MEKNRHLEQHEDYRYRAGVLTSPKEAGKPGDGWCFSLLTDLWKPDVCLPPFTFIWPALTGRLRVTSRWVRNQDLDTSSPAGTPRLHPPFHTPQEQQQRKGLVPPGFGDEVRKLHALWWMSYPCLSLPSGDDAGKVWSQLFLNETVGHAFRQECN